jgi:molybdopterin-guanine dinucleotide biosynthesis protein A
LTGMCRQRYTLPMERKVAEVTGVILVGGKSRRMGVDKAFLEIDGTPLFERVLRVFQDVFVRTILIGDTAGPFSRYGLPVYPDIYSGSALGGLYTGLVHGGTPHIFVSACDVPFPSSAVVRHLISLRNGFDAVVPTGSDGFEPLFAVYSATCRELMKQFLEIGAVRIFDLFPELNVRTVPVEELARLDGGNRTFVNINTPEDLARVTRRGPTRTD